MRRAAARPRRRRLYRDRAAIWGERFGRAFFIIFFLFLWRTHREALSGARARGLPGAPARAPPPGPRRATPFRGSRRCLIAAAAPSALAGARTRPEQHREGTGGFNGISPRFNGPPTARHGVEFHLHKPRPRTGIRIDTPPRAGASAAKPPLQGLLISINHAHQGGNLHTPRPLSVY